MNDRILFQSVTEFSDAKADKLQLIKGLLGAPIGGETVEVPNRPGYVYVRLRDNQNEFISAYNSEVALVYNLPVLVARDEVNPNVYRVVGRDLAQYKDWGDSAYVPRHGNAHSFNLAGGGGGDVVWIYSEQIVPIGAIPSGSSGAAGVIIAEGGYWWEERPVYAGNTGTADLLTGNRPTGANGVRVVLVYLDGESGVPGFIAGDDEFDYTITGTMDLLPFVPDLPTDTIPIAAIRIPSGTSSIVWENIYDLRNFFGTGAGEGCSGFTEGSVIFANASGSCTEDNDQFFWDDTNKNLLIGNNVSPFSDDTSKLQLIGSTGRNVNMYMWGFSGTGTSVVPSFAGINFRGTQSNPTATLAGDILLRAFGSGHSGAALTASRVRMTFLADGDWDGAHQGTYINFQVTHTGSATRRNVFDIHGDEAVFNPDMLNDLNFRMAGSNSPYLLYLRTSDDHIGINNDNPDALLHMNIPTATDIGLILQTTDDNATKSLLEARDSGGAAIFKIKRAGVNTIPMTDIISGRVGLNIGGDTNTEGLRTNATTKFARFTLPHYTNAEEPILIFQGQAGSTFTVLDFGGGSGSINSATHIRFYTGPTSTTLTGVQRLEVDSAGLVGVPDTNIGGQLGVQSQLAARVAFIAKAHASQSANLQEWQDSSANVLALINSDGGAIFNNADLDTDVRIKGSGDANLVWIDGGSDRFGIGTNVPGFGPKLDVYEDGGQSVARYHSRTALTETDLSVVQWKHTTSATPKIGFGIANYWIMDDDANVARTVGYLSMTWDNPDTASYDSRFGFFIRSNSLIRERLSLRATGTVFNLDEEDVDYRIATVSGSHSFFIRGDDGFVGINQSNPADTFDVEGYALFDQSHGELYTHETGLQVDAVTADTWYEVSGTTAGLSSGGNYVTLAAAGGDITIGSMGAGIYRVSFTISMEANKACTLHGAVYVNGAKQNKISWRRDIANPNDVGSASAVGLLSLSAADIIDIRLTSDVNNTTIGIDHMNLSINRFAR